MALNKRVHSAAFWRAKPGMRFARPRPTHGRTNGEVQAYADQLDEAVDWSLQELKAQPASAIWAMMTM